MQWITHHNKAIMGFVITGLVSFLWAYMPDHQITADEWQSIILSAFGAAGVVFAVPNTKRPGTDDSNKE